MNNRFDIAFERVISHEGGFTDNPKDPGNWTGNKVGSGKLVGTKFGIAAGSNPNVNIKELSLEQAKAIYRKNYWEAGSCDLMPIGIDYLIFDLHVNHGISRGSKILQQAVGVVADGKIGSKTLLAVNKMNPRKIATEMAYHRMMFYTQISTFKTFGKGWTRRAIETYGTALADIDK